MSLQNILSATIIYGLAAMFPPIGLFLGILYRFFGRRLLAPTDHEQVGNNLMVMSLVSTILYFVVAIGTNVLFIVFIRLITAQTR